jgi:hypothetical protein
MHQPLLDTVLLQFVKVGGTQVLIGLLPRQQVVHNGQMVWPKAMSARFLPRRAAMRWYWAAR